MAKSKSLVGVKVPAIVSGAPTPPPAPLTTAAEVHALFRADFEVKKKGSTDKPKTFSVKATANVGGAVSGLRFELINRAELFSLGDFVDFLNETLELPVTRANFEPLPDAKGLLGMNLVVTDFLIDTFPNAKPKFKAGVEVSNEKEPWNPIGGLKLRKVLLVISDQKIEVVE